VRRAAERQWSCRAEEMGDKGDFPQDPTTFPRIGPAVAIAPRFITPHGAFRRRYCASARADAVAGRRDA